MMYLIWSNEHGGWWRPAEIGYTTELGEAGRYTEERADDIVSEAGDGPSGEPNEVMVVAPKHSWHGRG